MMGITKISTHTTYPRRADGAYVIEYVQDSIAAVDEMIVHMAHISSTCQQKASNAWLMQ